MEYTNRFETVHGPVSTFGGHAYDGLLMAVDAIKRTGSTDKQKQRAALEQTQGFIGTAGVFNTSAPDHMGLGLEAFKLLEIRNGDWVIVE